MDELSRIHRGVRVHAVRSHWGEGGAIPLCNVLADTYPDAELILMGVEEPLARVHAPNESVDPAEIAAMALTEALFLQRYAGIRSGFSHYGPA